MPTLTLQDGSRLNYRIDEPETGSRGWIVFSNSLMTSLSIWNRKVDPLFGDWSILRYDQRGHGNSDVPASVATIPQLAYDLIELVDEIGIETFSYVGLSMGVPTGILAATRMKPRVNHLILSDGMAKTAPTGKTAWTERIEFAEANGMTALAEETAQRWLQPAVAASDVGHRLREMIAATPLAGFTACANALKDYDCVDAFASLDVPITLIAGADDGAIPAAMEALKAHQPDASFHPIASAGHIPNFEQPEAFNAVLWNAVESRAAS